MSRIIHPGQAGTIESNDILITVMPSDAGSGISIEINSPVIKQYGAQIRQVIVETLTSSEIEDANIHVTDRGALNCTIRARLRTAILRAGTEGGN
ncbi:citrate lyase subunit gamma (acyl carrier protein) [Anaerospora hongkongensis]|uniref:Citrate lyase subunit gamma (Acyl carrier protein) n=1 Tax=Anaerospora hongkongensis TaxID=244830 RepID=A0A4V2Q920_9FIRM|nr:citrate lyase acyl carrier protein [Anaerospora hongkongensis]TCL39843.1 citrate lyase subunit gamma (acyl carrier protein) [Anaerospora hongkongensis]